MAVKHKKPGASTCEIGFVLYLLSHSDKFRRELKRDPQAAYASLGIKLSKAQLSALEQDNKLESKGHYFDRLSELGDACTSNSEKAQRTLESMRGFGVATVAMHRCEPFGG